MLDKDLAKSLFEILIKVRGYAKSQFTLSSDFPLTETQFKTLIILRNLEKSTLKQLSDIINVSSSSLSIMLNKLVDDGWVERHYHKSDRRLTFFVLSKKGEDLIKSEVNKKVADLEKKLAALSDIERVELAKSLATIEYTLKQIV